MPRFLDMTDRNPKGGPLLNTELSHRRIPGSTLPHALFTASEPALRPLGLTTSPAPDPRANRRHR